MDGDLEAIGTNAHELPMVAAALAEGDDALRAAPCRAPEEWREHCGGNLLVALPDAFGTAAFLRDAPGWLADWTGFRPDSAPPIDAGERIIAWWRARGRDPAGKLLIFADGMDGDTIEATPAHFAGRVWTSGGTNLTNDARGCDSGGGDALAPISLVCKVVSADGRPAIKLSGNPDKATGDPAEIARHTRSVGDDGRASRPILV